MDPASLFDGRVPLAREDADDDCGSTMLYYFVDPEQTLHFPNFGAQLRISESGNGNIN